MTKSIETAPRRELLSESATGYSLVKDWGKRFAASYAARKARRGHLCAKCGRQLKEGRWVLSGHTGKRYCYPGEGCDK